MTDLFDAGIESGMEKCASRKRGPWSRRLMSEGAAVGGLHPGGCRNAMPGHGYKKQGTRRLSNACGASKTAAVSQEQAGRAFVVARDAVRLMGPGMSAGAMAGGMVSALRAKDNTASEAIKGALLGSIVGGLVGTGGAVGMMNSKEDIKYLAEAQRTIGGIAGGLSGFSGNAGIERHV